MSPSQFAATNILPLLARIVLCLAFLPQGWKNLWVHYEFTGTDAQRLRELGVRGVKDPDPVVPGVSLGAVRGEMVWAELQQTNPPADNPGKPGAHVIPPETAGRPAPRVTEAVPALSTPRTDQSPLAPLKELYLYGLALNADHAHLPFPIQIAWGVAAVQLIGGGCILLGLFSRIWGLLMTVIIVGVFVTGTLPQVTGKWFFGMSSADFNLVFAQMGLFVMALSIFLVGPGALSLDRAIFRHSRIKARKPVTRKT